MTTTAGAKANELILISIEQAANALLSQAKELSQHPEKDALASARPLRELQMQFSQISQLPFSSTDKFLLFFISLYIEDIFSNILADTPFSEDVKSAREALFYEIGKLLKELADSYQEGKESDLYKIYKELVRVYLEKIDFLNLKERRLYE